MENFNYTSNVGVEFLQLENHTTGRNNHVKFTIGVNPDDSGVSTVQIKWLSSMKILKNVYPTLSNISS